MKYILIFFVLFSPIVGIGQNGNGTSIPSMSLRGLDSIGIQIDTQYFATEWLLHHHRDFIYNIDSVLVHTGWGKKTRTERPPFIIRLGGYFYYPDGRTRIRLIKIYYNKH